MSKGIVGARVVGIALAAAALFTAGCSGSGAGPTTVVRSREPVALGVLPESPMPLAPLVIPPTTPPTTAFERPAIMPITGPIGEVVEGNRVLLIGSTAMATLTERQGGIACTVLSELGWQIRIEAEVGRFIGFADQVIDTVVVDQGRGWDVIGLMFGLFVDTTPEEFGAALDALIGRLDGRPVLLYTVASRVEPDDEPDETALALNQQIALLAVRHPNVVIIDWADEVDNEDKLELVDRDRVPTPEGVGRLVLLTSAALGPFPPVVDDTDPAATSVPGGTAPSSSAPSDSTVPTDTSIPGGGCIDAIFTDDTAIVV